MIKLFGSALAGIVVGAAFTIGAATQVATSEIIKRSTIQENMLLRAVSYCQGDAFGDSDKTQGSIDYLVMANDNYQVVCDNGANVILPNLPQANK